MRIYSFLYHACTLHAAIQSNRMPTVVVSGFPPEVFQYYEALYPHALNYGNCTSERRKVSTPAAVQSTVCSDSMHTREPYAVPSYFSIPHTFSNDIQPYSPFPIKSFLPYIPSLFSIIESLSVLAIVSDRFFPAFPMILSIETEILPLNLTYAPKERNMMLWALFLPYSAF